MNSVQRVFLRNKLHATIDADGVLRKNIDGSKHMLRQPRAIAWDAGVIEAAMKAGAHAVEVTDRETGTCYRLTLVEFSRLAFTVDRGFGKQRAVELRHWQRIGADVPVQLGLGV